MAGKSTRPRTGQKRSSATRRLPQGAPEATQNALRDAERELLEIADCAYAHTCLKPISKTLFFISRCLFVAKSWGARLEARELAQKYAALKAALGNAAP